MDWYKISLLLCIFGFLKEIRPSEPFVSDYMQEPYRNVTSEELNRYIYPIATYSNLILSIVVLLITDLLRYKPMIVFTGIAGIVTWSLLLWTKSFFGAQLLEVTYAAYSASEVAYFAYIYAKVSKDHYSAVSSHTRASLLVGRFVSGVLSQLLMHFGLMGIHELNYISLGAQVAATLFAIFLPKVNESIYFYRRNMETASVTDIVDPFGMNAEVVTGQSTKQQTYRQAFRLMRKQLESSYSNRQVVLWSIWYAFGMCGFLQILSYVQLLWIAMDNRPEFMWNGAVEAVTTLLCAAIAMLASRLHSSFLNSKLKILWILFTLSIFASGAIFLTGNAGHRFVSYAGYMIFYMLYTFTITIASAEIAKELPEDSYGLIFGINTFAAYALQTLLTIVVAVDSFSLNLDIFGQFNVYGGYFIFLGLIYLLFILSIVMKSSKCQRTKPNPVSAM